MKRCLFATVEYSMSHVLGGDRNRRFMYGPSVYYFQVSVPELFNIPSPSFPAWTAQDIYDDAHMLPRFTEMTA